MSIICCVSALQRSQYEKNFSIVHFSEVSLYWPDTLFHGKGIIAYIVLGKIFGCEENTNCTSNSPL